MLDILKKIGEILGGEKAPEITQENFEDVKDANGNIIRIDKYEVGGKCQMISTDGTLLDLPDAEYTLEDGRKLTCAGGLITEISAPEVEDEVEETIQPIANADDTAQVESATKGDIEGKVGDITEKEGDRIAALEAAVEEIKCSMTELSGYIKTIAEKTQEFKEVKKQLSKEKEELSKTIDTLEKIPAANPIEVKASALENTGDVEYVKQDGYNWFKK